MPSFIVFSRHLLVYSLTFWNIPAEITVDRCNSALFHIYRNHVTSSHTCQQLCSFDSQLPKNSSLKHCQYVTSLIKKPIILFYFYLHAHDYKLPVAVIQPSENYSHCSMVYLYSVCVVLITRDMIHWKLA